MRVIAGRAGGIPLRAPRGDTRPITDRVKETLFAILGGRVLDARAVDLYAGSGAIGIEALSRGAASCDFVEQSRAAADVLRANLERSRLTNGATVRVTTVERFLAVDGERWSLAFLDPPYSQRAILAPLERLAPRLCSGATVVVKHFWRTEVPETPALAIWRTRRFGETALTFLERRADGGEENR